MEVAGRAVAELAVAELAVAAIAVAELAVAEKMTGPSAEKRLVVGHENS